MHSGAHNLVTVPRQHCLVGIQRRGMQAILMRTSRLLPDCCGRKVRPIRGLGQGNRQREGEWELENGGCNVNKL